MGAIFKGILRILSLTRSSAYARVTLLCPESAMPADHESKHAGDDEYERFFL